MRKLDQFFADMKKQLDSAIEGDAGAGSDGSEFQKALNGTGNSALVKAINTLDESTKAHTEILEKVLDRVENLEKNSSMRKSIAGDDFEDGDGKTKVQKKSASIWDGVVRQARKNGVVTLN